MLDTKLYNVISSFTNNFSSFIAKKGRAFTITPGIIACINETASRDTAL